MPLKPPRLTSPKAAKAQALRGPSFNAPRENPLEPPASISIPVPALKTRGPTETSKVVSSAL
ncbi:hypothetical protein D3C80_1935260 [compost metagenome]